jgi:hypothetical protein
VTLELLALLWMLDTSYIECRHAAVRRLLRVMSQSSDRDLEAVSADLMLLTQRILESSSVLASSSKLEKQASAKDAKTKAHVRKRPAAPNKKPAACGDSKRQRPKPKTSDKHPGHGGGPQRTEFSRVLREESHATIKSVGRSEYFRMVNASIKVEKETNSEYYAGLVRSGQAAKRSVQAGGHAFGPPKKILKVEHDKELLDGITRKLGVDMMAQATTRETALAVPSSSSPSSSCLLDLSSLTIAERGAYRRHRDGTSRRYDMQVQDDLTTWSSEHAQPSSFGNGLDVNAISSVARPGGGCNDVFWWPAPGAAIVRKALSGRRKWKQKGRSAVDIAFRKAMLSGWKERHRPIRLKDIPKIMNVRPGRRTICWHAGFCVCKQQNNGVTLHRFAMGFRAMLSRVLEKGTPCRKAYEKAALIMSLKATQSRLLWLHISWGNLSTRMFTFMLLEGDSDPIRVNVAIARGNCVPLVVNEDLFENISDLMPNVWSLLKDLDYSLAYTCRFFRLSTDGTMLTIFAPGQNILVTPFQNVETFEAVLVSRQKSHRRRRPDSDLGPIAARVHPPNGPLRSGPSELEPLPLEDVPFLALEDRVCASDSGSSACSREPPPVGIGHITDIGEEDEDEDIKNTFKDMEAWEDAPGGDEVEHHGAWDMSSGDEPPGLGKESLDPGSDGGVSDDVVAAAPDLGAPSDAPASPPPDSAIPELAAPVRGRRVDDVRWPVLDLSSGSPPEALGVFPVGTHVRFSQNKHGDWDLRIKCGKCFAERNRTCRPGRQGQGRAMAGLCDWGLNCTDNRDTHKFLWERKFRSHEFRLPVRQWLASWAPANDWLDKEREPGLYDSPSDVPAAREPYILP